MSNGRVRWRRCGMGRCIWCCEVVEGQAGRKGKGREQVQVQLWRGVTKKDTRATYRVLFGAAGRKQKTEDEFSI